MDYNVNFLEWLNNPNLDSESKKYLLSIKDNEAEKKECFYADLEFGTGGIRGIMGVGCNRMNKYIIKRTTYALACYINSIKQAEKGVVVSYDTRNNSQIFAKITANILAANGVKVFLLKEGRPVPMLSFAVRYFGTAAGVMITASHNPKEYNGYKLYGDDGAQLNLEASEMILNIMDGIKDYISLPEAPLSAQIIEVDGELDEAYFDTIDKLRLDKDVTKTFGKQANIVYTSVHGTGYYPVTTMLNRSNIGYSVVESQKEYNGDFPTVKVPNPEFESTLSLAIDLAKSKGSSVVFGTDPDCDRLGVAIKFPDGEFKSLTGNQVGVLLLNYILLKKKEQGADLSNAVVIKSIVSTNLAKVICDYNKVEMQEVLVGFKFVGEKIKQFEEDGDKTYLFGFEESCGYLAGTHARDKDGVVASMLFAEMVCYYHSQNISLYEVLDSIYKKYGYYIDNNFSKEYKGVSAFSEMSAVMSRIREKKIDSIGGLKVLVTRDYSVSTATDRNGKIEEITLPVSNIMYFELEGGSTVCLRPSGTEPKLKIYQCVAGSTKEQAQDTLSKIQEEVKTLI